MRYLANPLFVRAIPERPQQAHGQRFSAPLDGPLDLTPGRLLVQRQDDGTRLVHTLRDLADMIPEHDGIWIPAQPVHAQAVARHRGGEAHEALNEHGVGEALGGEQPGQCPLALDQCVRCLGSAVAEAGHRRQELLQRQPQFPSQQTQPLEHAAFQLAGSGGRLRGHYGPRVIHRHQVGERAPGVDPYVELTHGYLFLIVR